MRAAEERDMYRNLGIMRAQGKRIATDGQLDRASRRARDRAAAKLSAAAEREVIAIRRGTKLSARDTFNVLKARRADA